MASCLKTRMGVVLLTSLLSFGCGPRIRDGGTVNSTGSTIKIISGIGLLGVGAAVFKEARDVDDGTGIGEAFGVLIALGGGGLILSGASHGASLPAIPRVILQIDLAEGGGEIFCLGRVDGQQRWHPLPHSFRFGGMKRQWGKEEYQIRIREQIGNNTSIVRGIFTQSLRWGKPLKTTIVQITLKKEHLRAAKLNGFTIPILSSTGQRVGLFVLGRPKPRSLPRQSTRSKPQLSAERAKPESRPTAKELQAYRDTGAAHFTAKRFAEARREFTKAIAGGANDAAIYFLRGQCYMRLRWEVSAIADFTKAIKRDSGRPEYYDARADAYAAMKQHTNSWRDRATARRLRGGN